jgi:hypothetical protein
MGECEVGPVPRGAQGQAAHPPEAIDSNPHRHMIASRFLGFRFPSGGVPAGGLTATQMTHCPGYNNAYYINTI